MDIQDLTTQVVAGAAAGALAVSGIKAGDRLVSVQDLTVASLNLVGQFGSGAVAADGTISNTGGTSTAGHLVLVVWEQRYGFRSPIGQGTRPSRTPY